MLLFCEHYHLPRSLEDGVIALGLPKLAVELAIRMSTPDQASSPTIVILSRHKHILPQN